MMTEMIVGFKMKKSLAKSGAAGLIAVEMVVWPSGLVAACSLWFRCSPAGMSGPAAARQV